MGLPLVEGLEGVVGGLFGADHFVSEVVSQGCEILVADAVVKYGVFQIVEQAIDKGALGEFMFEENRVIFVICKLLKN